MAFLSEFALTFLRLGGFDVRFGACERVERDVLLRQ
jgi:hypothetical protein